MLTAASMAELVGKLRSHLAGEGGIAELYQDEARREKSTLAVFAEADMAQIAGNWIDQGRYSKLLELWAKGAAFDWEAACRNGLASW